MTRLTFDFQRKSLSENSCEYLRLSLEISGRVQGVGFRPFVSRLARELFLTGMVSNAPGGVLLEVQGKPSHVEDFLARLARETPPGGEIEKIRSSIRPIKAGEKEFLIRASHQSSSGTAGSLSSLLPDRAVCSECLRELFDPVNRRYQYPLISCTACGPRYSITLGIPFDRCRTSLRRFPLCRECRREYRDPLNRRYHAQTIGCHNCGPKTEFVDGESRYREANSWLEESRIRLRSGQALALKGIGGFHLACDALNRKAIKNIRRLKGRPEKPLAIMAGSLAVAEKLAIISSEARRLLLSPESPIVLLPIRKTGDFPMDLLAPGLDRIGLFLPSTPIQHLLFGQDGKGLSPLVMTSANPEGQPIAAEIKEVFRYFHGGLGGVLNHGRRILERQDDSLVIAERKSPVFLRRSRGWIPAAFSLIRQRSRSSSPVVLALGGHQKVAPCRIRNGVALVLPHMGDLDGQEGQDFFRETLERFLARDGGQPTHLACDLHPDFPTSRMAIEMASAWGIPLVPVQHHHAHVASVMADRGIEGPLLGLSLDGFGLGSDGGYWGGELFRVERSECIRLSHFSPLPVLGGARAFREPWRMGAAVLSFLGQGEEARHRFSHPSVGSFLSVLEHGRRDHIPMTSSAGRLFDAAYSLLGGREVLTYEGQGAMELEALARHPITSSCDRSEKLYQADERGLDFSCLLERLSREKSMERGARLFHEVLASGIKDWLEIWKTKTRLTTVVLSGGVFQNRLLTALLRQRLKGSGFRVYEPRRVPSNDGGLALGQAFAVWASR